VTRLARLSVVLLVVVLAAACEQGDSRFQSQFASGFAPARHSVSVLGLYQEGRMSPEGWAALAPYMSAAFGSGACDVGYDDLLSSDATLAGAIDGYARENGPTDDLLGQLAPAAKGDAILVVIASGKVRVTADGGAPPSPRASITGGHGKRGRRGGGPTGDPSRPDESQVAGAFELAASLYSITQHTSVALVSMEYSGANVSDAMSQFAARVGQSFPQMHCDGWNWPVGVDADRIRQSLEP
jgi:hypothetical protein